MSLWDGHERGRPQTWSPVFAGTAQGASGFAQGRGALQRPGSFNRALNGQNQHRRAASSVATITTLAAFNHRGSADVTSKLPTDAPPVPGTPGYYRWSTAPCIPHYATMTLPVTLCCLPDARRPHELRSCASGLGVLFSNKTGRTSVLCGCTTGRSTGNSYKHISRQTSCPQAGVLGPGKGPSRATWWVRHQPHRRSRRLDWV